MLAIINILHRKWIHHACCEQRDKRQHGEIEYGEYWPHWITVCTRGLHCLVARRHLSHLPTIFRHCTCPMSGLQSFARIVMSGEASNTQHWYCDSLWNLQPLQCSYNLFAIFKSLRISEAILYPVYNTLVILRCASNRLWVCCRGGMISSFLLWTSQPLHNIVTISLPYFNHYTLQKRCCIRLKIPWSSYSMHLIGYELQCKVVMGSPISWCSDTHIMILLQNGSHSQSSYKLTWHIIPISYPAYNPDEGW